MIDAIELATRAQEERVAVARYVTKYLEKAVSMETEPGTADWFTSSHHISISLVALSSISLVAVIGRIRRESFSTAAW